MKSLLESLTTVNEELRFDGIVDNIKTLFCYDRLNNIQKDNVADIFRDSSSGVIYGKLMELQKNTDNPRYVNQEIKQSMNMCKKIYNALKLKS